MITIILEKGEYYPGQTIKGNIELVPDTDIYINDIELCFYFIENWNYLISDENTDKGNYKQCISVFNIGVNKYISENDNNLIHLDPILHLFPFEFKFPEFLYPSFEYPKHDFMVYLRYSLLAKIKSPYVQLSTSNFIFIHAISLKDNTSFFIENSFNIKKWGIFGKGITRIKAFLPMKSFTFSDNIPIHIDVDNTLGKMKVTIIKINLIRKMGLKDNKNNYKEKYSHIDKVFRKVFKVEVRIGTKRDFDYFLSFNDISPNEFSYFDNVNLYNWTKRNCEFIPSIESTIISCQYFLKITLYYDSFIKKADRPRIRLPLYIVHKLQNNNFIPISNNKNKNITIPEEVNEDEIRKQKESDFVFIDKNNYNKSMKEHFLSDQLNRAKTINNNNTYIDNISQNNKEIFNNQIKDKYNINNNLNKNEPIMNNNIKGNMNNLNLRSKTYIENNEKNNNNIYYEQNNINKINEIQDEDEAPSCQFYNGNLQSNLFNNNINNNNIINKYDNNINKEQKKNIIYKNINEVIGEDNNNIGSSINDNKEKDDDINNFNLFN